MDKSKSSRRRRDRNPKQGAEPKGQFCGRRGKKHRSQDRKVQKQQRVNARERRIELDKRVPLITRVRPWMLQICSRCEFGLAIPRNKLETTKQQPHMFCARGRVTRFIWIIDHLTGRASYISVEAVQPWAEMSSGYLKRTVKRRWRPFKMKNILQILADETAPG